MSEFTWREIRVQDLPMALSLQASLMGDELTGRKVAIRCWEELLGHPAFRGIVVEATPPIGGHRIVSTGMGVMVTSSFMTAELENLRPGLNSRIIASLAQGQPVLLPADQIGRYNAGEGMDIVNLYGSWLASGLDPVQVSEINTLLAMSFLETFSGFRLRRVIREVRCEAEYATMHQSGVFRFYPTSPDGAISLAVLTKEDAMNVPHAFAGAMFRYRKPELRLGIADQQLLLAAMKGRTDEELCAELGLGLPTIKKRWLAIFARVTQVLPELQQMEEADSVRGRQKRHHVLAYLRAHPEELRPYDWTVEASAAAKRRGTER